MRIHNIRHNTFGSLAGIAIAIACVSGCGRSDGPGKVVVDGTITWEGEPLPNGEIRFLPIEDTTGPVSGGPIKDGKYTAKGRGGVPVGTHRVEIKGYRTASGNAAGPANPEGGPAEQYLPSQYNTDSQLKVTVDSDNTTHNFNLPIDQ